MTLRKTKHAASARHRPGRASRQAAGKYARRGRAGALSWSAYGNDAVEQRGWQAPSDSSTGLKPDVNQTLASIPFRQADGARLSGNRGCSALTVAWCIRRAAGIIADGGLRRALGASGIGRTHRSRCGKGPVLSREMTRGALHNCRPWLILEFSTRQLVK